MDKKMPSLILCTWWGSKMNHINSYIKSFGYMGLQIAIAEPFLAFPVEMVLVPIMLGANLVLHDIST
jgi:hypothetical protein